MKTSQKLLCIFSGIALLLGILLAFCCWPMPEGAAADGVSLGKMPTWNALRQMAQVELAPLRVSLPQEEITFSPQEYGIKIHALGAVQAARRAGTDISLRPFLRANRNKIRERLASYAAQYDTFFQESRWELTGTPKELATDAFDPAADGQTLTVYRGIPEAHLDVEAAEEAILEAFSHPASRSGDLISISVEPEKEPEPMSASKISQAVSIAPVNDAPDLTTGRIISGSYGQALDDAALKQGLENLDWDESLSLPLTYPAPEVLGEDAFFQDVLGEYETKHNTNENRNNNLRLLCKALDGYVLKPGETFSYNQVVGERTKERGYLPAPAYSGNRLTDAVGGGVCQGSTTLYNCVLLADLEVVFRACHGAKVTYVPYGLDATVNYLTTDFQFRNQYRFPVKIRAEVTEDMVKMKLLGTDEKDYYVKMETSWGQDDLAVYAKSYKCKYDKQTDELLSRDVEAFSTYYKNIG